MFLILILQAQLAKEPGQTCVKEHMTSLSTHSSSKRLRPKTTGLLPLRIPPQLTLQLTILPPAQLSPILYLPAQPMRALHAQPQAPRPSPTLNPQLSLSSEEELEFDSDRIL